MQDYSPNSDTRIRGIGLIDRNANSRIMNASVLSATLAPIHLERLPERPKVSILVSNYNYAEYIAQAIDSVLEQTYQNFELIISDDGSTDNSRKVISDYCLRDPRIFLITKENGGQASGFNAAFAASTGDLICFFDSDDIFRPAKLECMVEAHRQAPNAGFGVHRVQRVNKQRRPQGVWPLRSTLPHGWLGEQMLLDGGVVGYMPPTSGLSLQRSVAQRIFPLPESFKVCADQVIIRFAPLLTSVVHRQEVLAEYRLHGANSYERSKMTAESLSREITMCSDLWIAQRDFLRSLDPALVSQLRPLENCSYVLYLEYLHARLARSPSTVLCHQRYIHDIQNRLGPRMVRFWKNSIHLPPFIFDSVINLMNRQNLLKEILARLRGDI
jgi:glycosyltransferase involved in cell wall biosynthesis